MNNLINNVANLARPITLFGKKARYYDFSLINKQPDHSERPLLHFYGGNGFPVGVYEPLLTQLSQPCHVVSLAMRGDWIEQPAARKLTREEDADLLIEFLQQTYDRPVVGVGHSQGATATAIAAAKRPDLFSKLYLLEPVTFTPSQKWLYDLIPRALKMTQEPFKSTLKKRNRWDSVQQYYQHLRAHRAFKRINDEHLYIFANNSLVLNQEGGYTLRFSREQELANYFGTPYITDALKALTTQRLPFILVLGKPTLFNSDQVRASWQHIIADEQIITLPDYGHLLPMEAPERCAQIIFSTLDLDG